MLAIPLLFVMLFSSGIVRGETPTQASTLDELIDMFDSSSCKECHEKIMSSGKSLTMRDH